MTRPPTQAGAGPQRDSRTRRSGTRPARAGRRAAGGCLLAALVLLLAACPYPDVALTPVQASHPLGPGGPLETAAGASGDFGLGAPFVVIHFDAGPADPLAYEEPLAEAVAAALAQRPDASFHLLAVTGAGGPHADGEPGLERAEAVLRSLAGMGVPPERVVLGAAVAPEALSDEVRIYLR